MPTFFSFFLLLSIRGGVEPPQAESPAKERRQSERRLELTRPELKPASTQPMRVHYAETSLQKIFGEVAGHFGIKLLFDDAFRDKSTSVDLGEVSLSEALDELSLGERLFYKVIDPSTVLIAPDNAQRHRQYDDLLLHTFFIANADVSTIANMFRALAGIQRVQLNAEPASITVRATPDELIVAQRIVDLNDKEKPELAFSVEILAVPPDVLRTRGDSEVVPTFPSSKQYAQFKTGRQVEVLFSQEVRAIEKKAELKLEDEIPIQVPVPPLENATTPRTEPERVSFQYRTFGLRLSLTPNVSVDGVVEVALAAEARVRGNTRTVDQHELPVFRTRNVMTAARLEGGETMLLPTECDVRDFEGALGRKTSTEDNREVVVSVTPKLLRYPRVGPGDRVPLATGSEGHVRVKEK